MEKKWENLILTLSGAVIGAVIGAMVTIGASQYYYRKGGEDLQRQTGELKKLNSMMLTGMERMKWIELERDTKGGIIGFKPIVATLNATLPAVTFSAKKTVGPPPSGKLENQKDNPDSDNR
jgi:hypothetical protein